VFYFTVVITGTITSQFQHDTSEVQGKENKINLKKNQILSKEEIETPFLDLLHQDVSSKLILSTTISATVSHFFFSEKTVLLLMCMIF